MAQPKRPKQAMSPPPPKERTVEVPYIRSAKWKGVLAPRFRAGEWEMDLFRQIHPLRHTRVYPDLNGTGEGARVYLRFAEQLPDAAPARHPLARYLHYMRAYALFRLELGPEPDPYGPPIGLIGDDPLNVHPSNRRERSVSVTVGGEEKKRRRGYATGWSVRIRVDALLRGDDPEDAYRAACEDFAKTKGPKS
jgi:hypothetical protein